MVLGQVFWLMAEILHMVEILACPDIDLVYQEHRKSGNIVHIYIYTHKCIQGDAGLLLSTVII